MNLRKFTIPVLILLFFIVCTSVYAQQTPNTFFSKDMPSLGIYNQQFFDSYVNRDPELTKGYQALVEFRFKDAEKILGKITGDKSKKPVPRAEAYTFLGYSKLTQGQPMNAREYLEKAIELDPKNPMAYFFMANTYFLVSDFDNTEKYLVKAIELHPNFVAALRMLGETYKDQHQLTESAKYYKKILELLPNSGYYWYQYYKVAKLVGDDEEIVRTLKAMIELQPEFLLNHIRLGEKYVELGRLNEAMREFNFVIQKNPDTSRAYEGRAKVYLARDEFEKAMEEAQAAKGIDPDNVYVNSLISKINSERADSNRQTLKITFSIITILITLLALVYFFISHKRKQFIIRVIHDFNKSVDDLYELDALIVFILNFYMKLGDSGKGVFMLFNRQNNQLSVKEIAGFEDESIKGFSLFAGDEITNWLTGLKRYILSNEDLERDINFEDVFPSLKERLREMKLRYLFPLREKNQMVGFVAVDHFETRGKGPNYQRDLLMPISTTSAQSLSTLMLYETSISDETTGLFNKRYFRQSLSVELKRADRYNQPVSLVTFDIDNFKRLNDTYGHPQGDVVLKELGELIRKTFREGIDVGARTGGEEFTIILPATEVDKGAAAAERIRTAVQNHNFPGFPQGSNERVTISIGLATYPIHAQSDRALIEKSDEALYRAKRTGKNKVCVVDSQEEPEMMLVPDSEPVAHRQAPVSPTLLDETGLYSRGYFDERYTGEVKRAERTFRPCSMLMIKPDIEISHTELIGILKDISAILRSNLRRGIDVPARFEKDIIVILLPEVDHNRAAQIARRIKSMVDKSTPLAGNQRVTFSIGVSNYPNLGRTEESFLDAARQSLRMCQQMGGDRAMIATPI